MRVNPGDSAATVATVATLFLRRTKKLSHLSQLSQGRYRVSREGSRDINALVAHGAVPRGLSRSAV
jgi:hypothetical protein